MSREMFQPKINSHMYAQNVMDFDKGSFKQ